MGSILAAKVFISDDKVAGQGSDATDLFRLLELKEADINVLYTAFCMIANKGDCKVSFDRILLYCKTGTFCNTYTYLY